MATKKKKTTKKKPAKRTTKKKTAAKKKPAKKKTAKKKTAKKKTAKRKPAKKKVAKKKTAKKKPAKKKTAKKKTTKRKTAKRKPAAKKKATKKKSAAKKKAEPKKAEGPTPPSRPILVTPRNKSTKQYTQSEFFESLQGSLGFQNKKQAKEFYAAFSEMIHVALKKGYKLSMPGLGKMQVRKSKARMGRNPMTQEPIKIPARKRVRFTPNKALKDAVL